LEANTGYYIEITNGALEDLSGNDFGGISGQQRLAFTTVSIFMLLISIPVLLLSRMVSHSSAYRELLPGHVRPLVVIRLHLQVQPPSQCCSDQWFCRWYKCSYIDWLISPSFDLYRNYLPFTFFLEQDSF